MIARCWGIAAISAASYAAASTATRNEARNRKPGAGAQGLQEGEGQEQDRPLLSADPAQDRLGGKRLLSRKANSSNAETTDDGSRGNPYHGPLDCWRLSGFATAQPSENQVVASDASALLNLAKQLRLNEVDARQVENRMNQKFGNMLEAIRANKGLEEDKAKKIQAVLQSMKNAEQSTNDFIGTFIDLVRDISQKIMR